LVRSASKVTLAEGITRRLVLWIWATSSRSRGRSTSRRWSRILKSVHQRSLLALVNARGDLREGAAEVLGEVHADLGHALAAPGAGATRVPAPEPGPLRPCGQPMTTTAGKGRRGEVYRY